jgi:hypothetical protein
MKSTRLALPLFLAAACAAGCRTGTLSNLNPAAPKVFGAPKEKASELLAEHNKNAERIARFEARPSITVWEGNRSGHSVNGTLAVERPRNFKLKLKQSVLGDVADIGSNDQEFWYWIRPGDDSTPKAIYFCRYEDAASGSVPSTFQPDWMIEALGFRPFTPEEMDAMTVKEGKDPGTVVLTLKGSTSQHDNYTREIVLSEADHRIREQRIYAPDGKKLAQAVVKGLQEIPNSPKAPPSDPKVIVPAKLRLDWFEEKIAFDVTLNAPKANVVFSAERRNALFTEPKRSAEYQRVNLADLARPGAGSIAPREGRRVQDRDPQVKLGDPAPLGPDETRLTSGGPLAFSGADSQPRRRADSIIEPRVPNPADPPGAAYDGQPSVTSRAPRYIDQ